jgi:DNA ligase-1
MRLFEEIGDLGKTTYQLLEKKPQTSLLSFTQTKEEEKEFEVIEIWEILDKIAGMSGEGSADKKIKTLAGLISKVTPLEARFIIRIVIGQLRIGVESHLLLEALSVSKTGSRESKSLLERAYNRNADIGFVAEQLYKGGIEAVKQIKVRLFNPIRVMLAQRVSNSEELLEKFGGKCSLEYKYDGLRVQIHKKEDKIKLFSRKPEDITNQFPDVIKFIKEAAIEDEIIIEGEIVAYDLSSEKILPFQQVAQRKRKYDVDQKIEEIPVRVYLFDVLYCYNESRLDTAYLERRKLLTEIIKETENIKFSHQLVVDNTDDIEIFFNQALENSCEGVMGKDVSSDSIYQAGARGWNWVKFKQDYILPDTFDLVIIGADYGKGKRAGKYGTFLLGCYNPENLVYQTFTWVGAGFSDEDLDTLYKMLKPLSRDKSKQVESDIESPVWFDPQVVIEIEGAEITVSPMHTCAKGELEKESDGLALRFPRFTGKIVEDRLAEQATSTEEIHQIYLNKRDK